MFSGQVAFLGARGRFSGPDLGTEGLDVDGTTIRIVYETSLTRADENPGARPGLAPTIRSEG